MEGGSGTTLKVQGAVASIDLFEGDYGNDDGTVIGQAEGFVLPVEDDRAIQPVQDGIVTTEDDSLEREGRVDEEEVAAPIGPAKRPATAPAENNRDKRTKTNAVRVPPLKVNAGTSQGKSASFSNQLFERMDANAWTKEAAEQNKLDWDKEKWRLERVLRMEERMAEIESKRLTVIAALVQQGITDRDLILSILNTGSQNK
ncbi:hypothetical protein BGZ50_009433 [Haplosporangium sp. Z 11]|nr:hypothetical protein BGZ50_009433 [Haplosporangium sp. Z 11]